MTNNHRLQRLKRAIRTKHWDRRNTPCRINPNFRYRRVGFRITVAVNLSRWYWLPRMSIGHWKYCHWLCGRCWWTWEWQAVEEEPTNV